jgi:hypothetical protein
VGNGETLTARQKALILERSKDYLTKRRRGCSIGNQDFKITIKQSTDYESQYKNET